MPRRSAVLQCFVATHGENSAGPNVVTEPDASRLRVPIGLVRYIERFNTEIPTPPQPVSTTPRWNDLFVDRSIGMTHAVKGRLVGCYFNAGILTVDLK